MAATCSIITVITTISPALDTSSETTVTSTVEAPQHSNSEISRSEHHSFVSPSSCVCHEPRRKFQKYSDFHHQQDILHPMYRLIIFTVRDEKLEQLKVSQRT